MNNTLDWKPYPTWKPHKDSWVFVMTEEVNGTKAINKEYYLKNNFANNDSITKFFIVESELLASIASNQAPIAECPVMEVVNEPDPE